MGKILEFLRSLFGIKHEVAEAIDAVVDTVEKVDDAVEVLSPETRKTLDVIEDVVEQYCDEGDK